MPEIIYSSYASSVFKAVLLAKLTNNSNLKNKEEKSSSLFDNCQIDIDKYPSRDLYNNYCNHFHELNWVHTQQFSQFKKIINLVFRHKKEEKFRLIENVIIESLHYGLQFVFANSSRESRRFFQYYSSVAADIHANKGLSRLQPLQDGSLLGQIASEHNTGDIVLQFFARRFPQKKIILVDKNKDLAFIQENNHSYVTSKDNYQKLYREIESKDLYSKYWQSYYETQYIPEKKNSKLALKNLPRKRWHDSFEIEFLKKHLDQ